MKLILFLHFHKAGGTSINTLFNDYNKHEPNKNGNPWNQDGIIDYWNYNRHEFGKFRIYLKKKNVNFICLEWNFFKHYYKLNYHNMDLITCLRDPYKRYVSNMIYDGYYDIDKFYGKKQIWKKKGSKFKISCNKYNYYVRMLNGLGDNPNIKINGTHYKIAKRNLGLFSTIIILDIPETFQLLEKYNITDFIHQNRTSNKDEIEIKIDKKQFIKDNKFDYMLYEHAKYLSSKQLRNLKAQKIKKKQN